MRKIIMTTLLLMLTFTFAAAQKQAEIKFDKKSHNFGKFSEQNSVQKCTFTFTNVGDAPLVINQAVASCGCTVPQYTKAPIAPGEKGTIEVTYNGAGKIPGLDFSNHLNYMYNNYFLAFKEQILASI